MGMGAGMATSVELQERGFRECWVKAKRLNIDLLDPLGRGPFCRLVVEDTAPLRPGVYAWVRDDKVMYVGSAGVLRQIVHGARMGRAYNDYTYIPPSKVNQASSPRVADQWTHKPIARRGDHHHVVVAGDHQRAGGAHAGAHVGHGMAATMEPYVDDSELDHIPPGAA